MKTLSALVLVSCALGSILCDQYPFVMWSEKSINSNAEFSDEVA